MKIRGRQVEITTIVGIVLVAAAAVYAIVWLHGRAKINVGEKAGYGLFSWEEELVKAESWDELLDCMEKTDSTVIYQQFAKQELNEANAYPFVRTLRENGKDVYALIGAPQWAYETDGKHLIKWIRRVASFNINRGTNATISGIMVDVEPYLLEEWDASDEQRTLLMEGFLDGIRAGYSYAKSHGLTYLVCVPTFYDVTNYDVLEELIAECCDGVAVMNYNREDEPGQIESEVALSEEYGKQIVNIYELQKSGGHGLEEINTYAGLGLDALWESADGLQKRFGYDRLTFAYHYYKPLREMLEKRGER